jgi:hypothetical protein
MIIEELEAATPVSFAMVLTPKMGNTKKDTSLHKLGERPLLRKSYILEFSTGKRALVLF